MSGDMGEGDWRDGESPREWRSGPGGRRRRRDSTPDDDDTRVIGRAAVPGSGRSSSSRSSEETPDEPERPSGPPDDESETFVHKVMPPEDEASPLVARYLFPTERYRGEWRQHIIQLSWPAAIGLITTFALGWSSGMLSRTEAGSYVGGTLVLVWLAVMGYVAWRIIDWHYDRFILTNKRVMKISGVVTRNVAMMPLTRVTDMKYSQSPLGRLLNYGTFILESAGQEQALREIPRLPNPNELYIQVVEEMYEPMAVEGRLSGAGQDPEDLEDEDEDEQEDERVGR